MPDRITLDVQLAAVRREIALRKNVYAGWVKSGRMKQEKADSEIAAMQAVHDTLDALQRRHAANNDRLKAVAGALEKRESIPLSAEAVDAGVEAWNRAAGEGKDQAQCMREAATGCFVYVGLEALAQETLGEPAGHG